ncbi:hypothetical protein TWF730_000084 [Orbilia blumenaviensis]|uniref:Uncharacterized protein n=1 Tax=Orbilia blumenaviensis TaxID=1796055 RepID=A0AAV9VMT2_9PEZI
MTSPGQDSSAAQDAGAQNSSASQGAQAKDRVAMPPPPLPKTPSKPPPRSRQRSAGASEKGRSGSKKAPPRSMSIQEWRAAGKNFGQSRDGDRSNTPKFDIKENEPPQGTTKAVELPGPSVQIASSTPVTQPPQKTVEPHKPQEAQNIFQYRSPGTPASGPTSLKDGVHKSKQNHPQIESGAGKMRLGHTTAGNVPSSRAGAMRRKQAILEAPPGAAEEQFVEIRPGIFAMQPGPNSADQMSGRGVPDVVFIPARGQPLPDGFRRMYRDVETSTTGYNMLSQLNKVYPPGNGQPSGMDVANHGPSTDMQNIPMQTMILNTPTPWSQGNFAPTEAPPAMHAGATSTDPTIQSYETPEMMGVNMNIDPAPGLDSLPNDQPTNGGASNDQYPLNPVPVTNNGAPGDISTVGASNVENTFGSGLPTSFVDFLEGRDTVFLPVNEGSNTAVPIESTMSVPPPTIEPETAPTASSYNAPFRIDMNPSGFPPNLGSVPGIFPQATPNGTGMGMGAGANTNFNFTPNQPVPIFGGPTPNMGAFPFVRHLAPPGANVILCPKPRRVLPLPDLDYIAPIPDMRVPPPTKYYGEIPLDLQEFDPSKLFTPWSKPKGRGDSTATTGVPPRPPVGSPGQPSEEWAKGWATGTTARRQIVEDKFRGKVTKADGEGVGTIPVIGGSYRPKVAPHSVLRRKLSPANIPLPPLGEDEEDIPVITIEDDDEDVSMEDGVDFVEEGEEEPEASGGGKVMHEIIEISSSSSDSSDSEEDEEGEDDYEEDYEDYGEGYEEEDQEEDDDDESDEDSDDMEDFTSDDEDIYHYMSEDESDDDEDGGNDTGGAKKSKKGKDDDWAVDFDAYWEAFPLEPEFEKRMLEIAAPVIKRMEERIAAKEALEAAKKKKIAELSEPPKFIGPAPQLQIDGKNKRVSYLDLNNGKPRKSVLPPPPAAKPGARRVSLKSTQEGNLPPVVNSPLKGFDLPKPVPKRVSIKALQQKNAAAKELAQQKPPESTKK